MALANMAMSDAGVAAWDAKYTYKSGHATYSGGHPEVLAWIFPESEAHFRAKPQEAADARLWGGIH